MILVLVAVLVLFGAKRIPEFAKGLGKGINEFKKASREVVDSVESEAQAPVTPKAPVNTTAQTQIPPHETKSA
jgi:sec-independent protein translocase protein TatA